MYILILIFSFIGIALPQVTGKIVQSQNSEPKKREKHEIKEHFFAAFVFLDILGKHFCYTISLYSAINSIILHDISNARISQTGMKKL